MESRQPLATVASRPVMSRRHVPYATFGQRCQALFIDTGVVVGALAIPYCTPAFPSIGSAMFWMLLVGGHALLQFVGVVWPAFGIGRSSVGIHVVSSHTFGRPTWAQAALRAAFTAAFALAGVAIATSSGLQEVAIMPLLIESMVMLNHPRRQRLADLVAGTAVVTEPPPQPHRAPAMPMYSKDDSELGPPPKR